MTRQIVSEVFGGIDLGDLTEFSLPIEIPGHDRPEDQHGNTTYGEDCRSDQNGRAVIRRDQPPDQYRYRQDKLGASASASRRTL